MTRTTEMLEVRRTASGAIDIAFYEARAARARSDIFEDVVRRTQELTKSFVQAGLRPPGF